MRGGVICKTAAQPTLFQRNTRHKPLTVTRQEPSCRAGTNGSALRSLYGIRTWFRGVAGQRSATSISRIGHEGGDTTSTTSGRPRGAIVLTAAARTRAKRDLGQTWCRALSDRVTLGPEVDVLSTADIGGKGAR